MTQPKKSTQAPMISASERRAQLAQQQQLIRKALGAQYPIYSERKQAQEKGGSQT